MLLILIPVSSNLLNSVNTIYILYSSITFIWKLLLKVGGETFVTINKSNVKHLTICQKKNGKKSKQILFHKSDPSCILKIQVWSGPDAREHCINPYILTSMEQLFTNWFPSNNKGLKMHTHNWFPPSCWMFL